MVNTLEELLIRIEKVTGEPPQKVGKGYKALCPAHEDVNPSLSIKAGDKHPYVIKCHAGCEYQAIMEALKDGLEE